MLNSWRQKKGPLPAKQQRRHEALAREAAAEERAIARHNELLTEMRLWRHHRHDTDGTIYFKVPE